MEIRVKVNSTYNNTIITALHKDRILKTISTGSIGFKKAKRASTLAAQAAGESLGYWLLLLDKALSQKTLLTKSKGDLSESSERLSSNQKSSGMPMAGGTRNASLVESVGEKTKSPKGGLSSSGGSKKSSVGGLSKESLENLQIKELANPKLKIPNAKLIPSQSEPKARVEGTGGTLSVSKFRVENEGRSFGGSLKKNPSSGAGSLTCIPPLSVMVSGVGHGKFGAIKGLAKMGIKIKGISDVTAIPHNGCKPPKMRRK
jgi:small subunit ribosomal protein S11